MIIYSLLSTLFPTRPPPANPRRIVLILPCCIGDVVMATATLKALREGFPDSHITWAVGEWSRHAVENHDLLDAILNTGPVANPARSPKGLLRFVQQLHAGNFDLAVSLARSPLVSLAVLLSGIPHRAGLDSAGRGFGYTIRASVDPAIARHEAEIYLDVAEVLHLKIDGYYANIPVYTKNIDRITELLPVYGVESPFIVVNPTGGSNPGMVMDAKRWPPENFAGLAHHLDAQIVLLGGPNDGDIVVAVEHHLSEPAVSFVGELSFGEIAALAHLSDGYIGNDTGLTHLAAAAGAKTVMIMGPSDPARYAPFTLDSLALWKPASLRAGGVVAGTPDDWDWSRDGIDVETAVEQVRAFLHNHH